MVYNIGIVVAEFNADITMLMLDIAKEHVKFLGGNVGKVIKVPGTFDMPLAIKKLLEIESINGVVTLGAVIEGDTDHDKVIVNAAARKMTDLSIEYNKPVSLGVSGPKMTRVDGVKRIDKFAKSSVEAVFKQLKNFEDES